MIVVAILATFAGLGFIKYQRTLEIAQITVAEKELQDLVAAIEIYALENGSLPASLDDLGLGPLLDPWGNPYQYLNFDTIEGNGGKRKDKFIVPINTRFDLYSVGPDGLSAAPLTAKNSQDDIIVANDGDYIGPASGY